MNEEASRVSCCVQQRQWWVPCVGRRVLGKFGLRAVQFIPTFVNRLDGARTEEVGARPAGAEQVVSISFAAKKRQMDKSEFCVSKVSVNCMMPRRSVSTGRSVGRSCGKFDCVLRELSWFAVKRLGRARAPEAGARPVGGKQVNL